MLMEFQINDLNVINGCVYEVIISTYGLSKRPNAAPMGLKFSDSDKFQFEMYKGSKTLQNLIEHKCGVANITYDAEVFYYTALKEENPKKVLSKITFQKSHKVKAPLIKEANFNLEFLVEAIEETKKETIIKCRIIHIEKNDVKILPYTRALFATIESIIHATRIKAFVSEGEYEKADELLGLVNHYKNLIKRVSPNSMYSKIMQNLIKQCEKWRKSSASIS
jgi:hypothetical protein